MNQQILDEITNQDYSSIAKNIEVFIKNEISENDSSGMILGLSGGIDSAVTAFLCANVSKKNTLGLVMPDTQVSPKTETEDAFLIIDKLGIDYKLIDINPIHNVYTKYLEPDQKAQGNLRARIRANLLYYYANTKNYLVAGSSDKSEYLIGYFTKFGDSSADFTPIISLYKTQVRELGKFLGVPNAIIEKKSSPHLWKGHVAEEEIGATYQEIDSILYCLIDKGLATDEIANTTNIQRDTVDRICKLHKTSKHKRMSPKRI